MSSIPAADAVLAARDIGFRYVDPRDGQSFTLDVPAIDVYAGEILALCGPSGSGKSTLLQILAGLLRPREGSVAFSPDGHEYRFDACTSRDWRAARRYIGFVSQDPRESLNDRRKVVDIVADPLRIHRLPVLAAGQHASRREQAARALEMLQRVGIHREQAERSPAALSGGQRQRVALARAMIAAPRLVFLDEPTSALDVSVQASIINVLEAFRAADRQAAFVLVTHDLPLARQIADRIAILHSGRIAEIKRVDDLFASPQSAAAHALLSAFTPRSAVVSPAPPPPT